MKRSRQSLSSPGREGRVRDIREGWRGRLFRGLRALESGDVDGAIAQFEAALALDRRPEVCYALGREHARAGRLDQAEPFYREAFADGDGMPVAGAALARLLGVGRGQLDEAHAVLEAAIARFPNEANLLIVRGELWLEADDPVAASACFEAALARGGDVVAGRAGLARAYNAEGILLAEGGDDERALFAFKRAASLDPDWSGPLVNTGLVFARLGRPARARSAYEEALRIEPSNALAYFNLGNLRRDGSDLEGARSAYEQALSLDPDQPGVRSALADVLGELGIFARAVHLFEEEIAREPAIARHFANLGLAALCLGEDQRAELSLRRALELDPDHVGALLSLATLLSRRGAYPEAGELARRASEIDAARARALLGSTIGPSFAPALHATLAELGLGSTPVPPIGSPGAKQ